MKHNHNEALIATIEEKLETETEEMVGCTRV